MNEMQRVLVTARGEEVELQLPDGSKLSVSIDDISRSGVLRDAVATVHEGDDAVLAVPKGMLQHWVQCTAALDADCQGPAQTQVPHDQNRPDQRSPADRLSEGAEIVIACCFAIPTDMLCA
jgi:hypothetical protein